MREVHKQQVFLALWKEKDEYFYCYQITTKNKVNSVSIQCNINERKIRRMCRNTKYMQRDRWNENQLAHVKVKS